jgi:hypothetical protein
MGFPACKIGVSDFLASPRKAVPGKWMPSPALKTRKNEQSRLCISIDPQQQAVACSGKLAEEGETAWKHY